MRTKSRQAMPGRALAAVLPLALAVGASRAPAQGDAEIVNGWGVRDERGFCSAVTSYDTGIHVRVTYDVRADLAGLHLWSPAWRWVVQGQAYDLGLRFSNGRAHRATGGRGSHLLMPNNAPIHGFWMSFSGADFLEGLGSAASVDLVMGERSLASFSLEGAGAVAQRLRACATESAGRHPSDPAGSAARSEGAGASGEGIARPPSQRSGIMDLDYPADALRAGEQGMVTIEMAVSADGVVTGCTVLRSSGSATLDSTTCAIALRRFRFTPAMDSNGRNVAGTATRSVRWEIPAPAPQPEPEPLPQR